MILTHRINSLNLEGGGDTPVPYGYKELLYIMPDCDENSVRYNEAAYTDLGPNRNDTKWEISFIDFSVVKQWYINNNIGTASTSILSLSNGETRRIECKYSSGSLNLSYFAQGYSSGSSTPIQDGIYSMTIDGVNAKLNDSIILNNGGGTISSGLASYTYPLGNGTDIPPIKVGKIKIYDVQDTLLQDWRPVEKLNGGDNRFGFYDVVNNVFKASVRAGRYLIPGPEKT